MQIKPINICAMHLNLRYKKALINGIPTTSNLYSTSASLNPLADGLTSPPRCIHGALAPSRDGRVPLRLHQHRLKTQHRPGLTVRLQITKNQGRLSKCLTWRMTSCATTKKTMTWYLKLNLLLRVVSFFTYMSFERSCWSTGLATVSCQLARVLATS